jgi:hypothetical protein
MVFAEVWAAAAAADIYKWLLRGNLPQGREVIQQQQ